MKDLIPTVKITNFAGVSSIKDGMKSNAYSKVEREKKPSWIRMTANQANQNYSLIKNKVKNLNLRQFVKRLNAQIYQNVGLEELLLSCLWVILAQGHVNSVLLIPEIQKGGLIKKSQEK